MAEGRSVCFVICGQADVHTFSFLLETIFKLFMNLKPSNNNTANMFCGHLVVYLVCSVGVTETSLILFKGKSRNVQTVQQILTHTENCYHLCTVHAICFIFLHHKICLKHFSLW